jgi:hypothetical protein
MTQHYAFNGDADGICALQQLRLGDLEPPGSLVTGVKRDINLLARVEAAPGDVVTVLDISLDVNRKPLLELLERGVSVRYFDHHFAGEIPQSALFEAHLDPAPDVCTCLIVDRYLGGLARNWAIVGAFGDSLTNEASALAKSSGLSAEDEASLKELGIIINYNAYGETVEDLHIAPAVLAAEMSTYVDPLSFARGSETFLMLRQGYREDIERTKSLEPRRVTPGALQFLLPNAPWARRASGTLANDLAKRHAGNAIALVSERTDGDYLVSLRVPPSSSVTADAFCRKFPTGGGRSTAAGINHLPASELERFSQDFEANFRAS